MLNTTRGIVSRTPKLAAVHLLVKSYDNSDWSHGGGDMYPEEDSGGFDESCNVPNKSPAKPQPPPKQKVECKK